MLKHLKTMKKWLFRIFSPSEASTKRQTPSANLIEAVTSSQIYKTFSSSPLTLACTLSLVYINEQVYEPLPTSIGFGICNKNKTRLYFPRESMTKKEKGS